MAFKGKGKESINKENTDNKKTNCTETEGACKDCDNCEDSANKEECNECNDDMDNEGCNAYDVTEACDDEASKVEALEKRYMMLFAEYDNYRKRSNKEKENLYADAVADVSSQWLAILDNIDRALESIKDSNDEAVVKGIEMIGKQAADVLSKIGISEIECQRGTAFDPMLHEAVMHIEDDSLGEQEVASVFQKGYIYRDKVIRHTVVQVAN